jgi:hypothetical protein
MPTESRISVRKPTRPLSEGSSRSWLTESTFLPPVALTLYAMTVEMPVHGYE